MGSRASATPLPQKVSPFYPPFTPLLPNFLHFYIIILLIFSGGGATGDFLAQHQKNTGFALVTHVQSKLHVCRA